MADSRNHVALTAVLEERGSLRYTPAGLAALDLVLRHQGESLESGGVRKVDLSLRAVAFGPLARQLEILVLGLTGEWAGFLASGRNGRGIVFHIQTFELSAT